MGFGKRDELDLSCDGNTSSSRWFVLRIAKRNDRNRQTVQRNSVGHRFTNHLPGRQLPSAANALDARRVIVGRGACPHTQKWNPNHYPYSARHSHQSWFSGGASTSRRWRRIFCSWPIDVASCFLVASKN